MNRAEANRVNLTQLAKATPFRPFLMNLENGDRILVEHPENLAFDSAKDGLHDVYVISSKVRYWGNLSAITTLALLDKEPLPSDLAAAG